MTELWLIIAFVQNCLSHMSGVLELGGRGRATTALLLLIFTRIASKYGFSLKVPVVCPSTLSLAPLLAGMLLHHCI